MDKHTEWIFTFGHGQPFQGKYVRIEGEYMDARNQMYNIFGDKWGFQYSIDEWRKMENDKDRMYPLETEISLEDAKKMFNGGL